MRRLHRTSPGPSRLESGSGSSHGESRSSTDNSAPTALDRAPSLSKNLDRTSMTPLEALQEMDNQHLGESRKDLLATEVLVADPEMAAAEKGTPGYPGGSPSTSAGDVSDDEDSLTYGHRQLLDEPLMVGNVTQRFKVLREQEGAGDNITIDVREFVLKQNRRLRRVGRVWKWYDWLNYFIPLAGVLRHYQWRTDLVADLASGLSVGAMVIPQGMSYAKLAGLPNVWGLYGAFVPVLVYAGLGSSRQLAVGPVAVTSLLLGSNIKDIIDAPVQDNPNEPHNQYAQDQYNTACTQVALIAGVIYTAVGILNLGWVTQFLSHSVIGGFMTGASLIIGLSQAKFLFGYNSRPDPASTAVLKLPSISFPRHDPIHKQLGDLFGSTWLPYFKWREFVMGISWIIILQTMKFLGQRYKRLKLLRALGPLTVTIISIAIMNIWGLMKAPASIRVVGKIPKGLPGSTVGMFSPIHDFPSKIGLAIVVCLIDILESISIARALALRGKYDIRPTQELRGLGVANIVGAMFNCYTTTGSFSRSAVSADTGSRTQVFGIVSAILVMIVLLVLTPVFKYMPQNAQGAIVISAVVNLFNYTEWWFLWKVNKLDWLVFNTAMFCVAFLGVEIGLAIAIGLSIAIVLYKTAFPHTAVLGRLPQTTVYRNVKQYPEAKQIDGLLVMRIDSPIYFANVIPVREAIAKYQRRTIAALVPRGIALRYIIIDMSPVTDIDASAVHWLKDWIVDLKERSMQPVLANPSKQVMRLLNNANLTPLLGEEFIFVRAHDAVQHCTERLIEEQKAGVLPPDPEDAKLAEVDVRGTLEDAGVKVGGLTGGVAPIGDVDLYLSPNGNARKRKE
ncbi:hypothetical protein WJX74_003191 [Apatococcus lobatus]|uniref:STAS domain-containing protein n=1 Tax=Apatococcus lobatus TaxID=904363 RepID=A0AAW1QE67_9CHLO